MRRDYNRILQTSYPLDLCYVVFFQCWLSSLTSNVSHTMDFSPPAICCLQSPLAVCDLLFGCRLLCNPRCSMLCQPARRKPNHLLMLIAICCGFSLVLQLFSLPCCLIFTDVLSKRPCADLFFSPEVVPVGSHI